MTLGSRVSRRRILAVSVLAAFLAVAAPSGAWAAMFQRTDPAHEVEIGREAAREVERRMPLSKDESLQIRVQRIGHALSEQMTPKMYPYEFKVLAVKDINAFSLPGGFIYINEGLLNRMPNDDSLAFIIGHEMAHAAHRHWAKHTEKLEGVSLIGMIASIAVGDTQGNIASLVTVLTSLSYSRDQERDADTTGMEYAWRAGFDTKGALDAMQALSEIEKGRSMPKFLRSHPPAGDRLKRLQAQSETLKAAPRPQLVAETKTEPTSVDIKTVVGDLANIEISEDPWFPLAVGDEWTYEVQSGENRSTYSVQVMSAIPVGEQKVYRLQTSFGSDVSVSCQMLATANQAWRRSKPTAVESPWVLEYFTGECDKLPCTIDGRLHEFVGKEQVVLPCGTFPDAVKIRKSGGDPPSTFDLYFVKGVGLVRRVCVETNVTETLIKYKVE